VTPVCMRLGCGIARTAKVELKVCSRCGVSRYCSERCQKLDWNDGHKNACQPALLTLHTDPPHGSFNAGDSRIQGLARSQGNDTCLHSTTSHAPQFLGTRFDSSLEVSESIPSHDEYTDSHALTDGSVVANADVEDVVAGGETREAEESVAGSTWARLRSIFRRG